MQSTINLKTVSGPQRMDMDDKVKDKKIFKYGIGHNDKTNRVECLCVECSGDTCIVCVCISFLIALIPIGL